MQDRLWCRGFYCEEEFLKAEEIEVSKKHKGHKSDMEHNSQRAGQSNEDHKDACCYLLQLQLPLNELLV